MFIASIVLVVAVVLFTGCYALFQIGTNLLKGAASNGNSKIYHYSDSGEVSVTSDCKLAVQVDIENRTNSAVNITSAKLAKHSNHGKTNYATINYNKKIAAGKGKKALVEYKFPIDKFPGAYSIAVVTYFNIDGTKYWKDESIDLSSSVIKKINSCKSTTKTVAGTNGWKKENGNWYYYESNKKVTGWKKLTWEGKNSWFYFESNGKMVTGWKEIKWSGANRWFYFDSEGRMATGWVKLKWKGGTDWFYFDPTDGYCYQDVCKTIDGKQYCFDKDGVWKDGNSNPNTTKSTNLKCTSSMGSVGSGNISCTTVAGALVEVFGQSPVTFMKTYTADSNGKISLSVPQEGSYLVQATKSGYTSTSQTVKVTRKKTLSQGNKVTLKNGYFYSSATAKKAATKTKKSGTYYIWSATIKNNRIRITTKKSYVGKKGKVTGWVNVSDLVY